MKGKNVKFMQVPTYSESRHTGEKRGCQERIRVRGDIVKFDENQRGESSEGMGTVMARCNKRRGWGG